MDKLRPPQAADSFIHLLGTDDTEFPRLNAPHPLLDHGEERAQVNHTVRWRPHEKDPEGQACQVLLVLEVPVHGQQGIKPPRDPPKQFTVLDAFPSLANDRRRIESVELGSKIGGQILVKKNAHSSAPIPSQVPALQWLERG